MKGGSMIRYILTCACGGYTWTLDADNSEQGMQVKHLAAGDCEKCQLNNKSKLTPYREYEGNVEDIIRERSKKKRRV